MARVTIWSQVRLLCNVNVIIFNQKHLPYLARLHCRIKECRDESMGSGNRQCSADPDWAQVGSE